MREKRDVIGLIKALQYKRDLEVRINAEKALGEMGAKIAVVPLIQALKDEDSDFRKRATAALRNIGEPTVEPLIQALKDEDSDFRS